MPIFGCKSTPLPPAHFPTAKALREPSLPALSPSQDVARRTLPLLGWTTNTVITLGRVIRGKHEVGS